MSTKKTVEKKSIGLKKLSELSSDVVKIYSTPSCPWCQKTKEFFKENNVKYQDLDVSVDTNARKEMFTKSGQMGVPVIEVGGTIIVGYDIPRLKRALNLK